VGCPEVPVAQGRRRWVGVPGDADNGVAGAGETWDKSGTTNIPTPRSRCGLMTAEPSQGWNVFKQIFADHWEEFKRLHHRYAKPYYDALVHKMLGCGDPERVGYIEYRCLQCGEGTHRVAMSCKSSLCLRCAKVYVDNWPRRAITAEECGEEPPSGIQVPDEPLELSSPDHSGG